MIPALAFLKAYFISLLFLGYEKTLLRTWQKKAFSLIGPFMKENK